MTKWRKRKCQNSMMRLEISIAIKKIDIGFDGFIGNLRQSEGVEFAAII